MSPKPASVVENPCSNVATHPWVLSKPRDCQLCKATHVCKATWAPVCHLLGQGHSVCTPDIIPERRVCAADCPCAWWTCTATATALNTSSETRTRVLSLLALSLSPSLVPDIERKKFLLPQRSPCAVPFFFFFFPLNVFWKRACFIHSKPVCSPG